MEQPKIADNQPKPLDIEEGKNYAWCACGLSQTQPLCDGSHKGTSFSPLVFKAEESKTVWMCMCKRTGNPGYCDGTHNNLSD